ncbi:MAG TPA: hypothetical protein DCE42_08075 [Myxococcales bacterium]|nr:hypothetical protein [Deltaproteobacteria bacterium]MBU48094.1 hypothetical protein [Deltaproteobacteria bacterium]HAA54701.1 hypothetical protein [Myxococcales bacterium]|tara:strand:- start:15123 stop:16433 length:1311 start_codon:yes stop_codon:yes gene_type:complete
MSPSSLFLSLWSLGTLPLLLAPWIPQVISWVIGYDLLLCFLFWLDARQTQQLPWPVVQRKLPNALTQAQPATLTLQVTNPAPTSQTIWLYDAYPTNFEASTQTIEVSLGPHEQTTVSYECTAPLRGQWDFGNTTIRTSSSLGLFRRQQQTDNACEIAVYPNLTSIKKYDVLARSHLQAKLGLRRQRRRGKGSEFDSLREYTPDDEYKHINWKVTAKRQFPVTQTFQAERSQNVLVVLDFGRTMGASVGDKTKLDAAIEATLLLCHVAQQFDDHFGLLLFSHKAETFIPPKKGKHHFRRILKALYPLKPLDYDIQYKELFRFIKSQHRKRSLIIFFTDLGDEEAAQRIQQHMPMLKSNHLPLCVSFADPQLQQHIDTPVGSASTLYKRTASLELLQDRQKILGHLQRHGILFLDTTPDDLSTETLNQYLQIKAKKLL